MPDIDYLKRQYYSTALGVTNVGMTLADLEYAFFTSPPPGGGSGTGTITSVNGDVGPAVVLDKGDVLLGNVDNTSDLGKPISTATQTALNTKAPVDSATFTGSVTVPAPSLTGHAATKGYVDTSVTTEATARSNADTTINNAIAISAVVIIEVSGSYTLPAGLLTTQGRIFAGPDNPGSLFREGKDFWAQTPAVP